MNAIQTFLRLRKQNDTVKLITLLVLFLLAGLLHAGGCIRQYAQNMHAKTEYRLTCTASTAQAGARLAGIRTLDGCLAAGIETESFIMLGQEGTTLRVRECTAEYLAAGYGITDKTFHLNAAAHGMLRDKDNRFSASFQQGSTTRRGEFQLDTALPDDTPCAFKCGTVGAAQDASGIVTIGALFQSADTTGNTATALEGMGFEILNCSALEQQKHMQTLLFVKLKYDVLLVLLLVLFLYFAAAHKTPPMTALRRTHAKGNFSSIPRRACLGDTPSGCTENAQVGCRLKIFP